MQLADGTTLRYDRAVLATGSIPTLPPIRGLVSADGRLVDFAPRSVLRRVLKLYEDNASTLTPDPVFVKFYYSHPPASERLARLGAGAPA